MLQVLGGAITLIASLFAWWVKCKNDKTAEKEALKKEIDNAIASGDISTLNALIDKLNKL